MRFPSDLRKKRFKAQRYSYGTGGYGFSEASTVTARVPQAETTALVARMTTQTGARQLLIDDLIIAGKAHGWWDKFDLFDVYAANDQASALLNWKGTSFTPTLTGTWTFTADRGLQRTITAAAINSGMNMNAGTQHLSSAMGVYFYSRTSARSGGTTDCDYGENAGAATTSFVSVRGPTDNFGASIQNSSGFYTATVLDSSGLWSITRSGSTGAQVAVRRNKTAVTLAGSQTATAMTANRYYFGRNGTAANNSATGREYSMFAIGANLSAAESDTFYDDLTVYLTALGAAV